MADLEWGGLSMAAKKISESNNIFTIGSSSVCLSIEYCGVLAGGTFIHEEIEQSISSKKSHESYALFKDLNYYDLKGFVVQRGVRVNQLQAHIKLFKDGKIIARRIIDTHGSTSKITWADEAAKNMEIAELESALELREQIINERDSLRQKDFEYVRHYATLTSNDSLERFKKTYRNEAEYLKRVEELKKHIFTDEDCKRLKELESLTGAPFF